MLKNLPHPKKIINDVRNKNYVIYDNVINQRVFKEIKKFWIEYFKDYLKFKSSDLYGSTRSLGDDNYNSFKREKKIVMFRRTEFPWNTPIHKPTQRLIFELNKVRNLALDLDENHGLLFNPDLEVSFSQINNYPDKEGTMFPHKDTKKNNLLLSCMFNITSKQLDFEDGGLYLIIKNKKIDIDSLMHPRSVVFYNGNLIHGVDKIKSSKGIGRIAGYPMKQFFLSKSRIPNYVKKIVRVDNAIRRKFNLKSAVKQGNSALLKMK
ncbi:hypothetical protein ACIJYG_00945 [Candidatus Pelagibacter bacterium nBUS_27]|uniref:hypothetical protein n=1 Tax=Candidatus Pelagibacter bacterium nBUS_27 TaxID=3374188 RepID=UPI003EB79A51